MDCFRLALANLYKASPKQSYQRRFFLCFFNIYLKKPVHVEGDLIVPARLQFGMRSLSRLFSWKLRHVRYTPGSSDSSFQFSDTCFTQITSSKIERSFVFDWVVFFSVSSISFDCRTQAMNWVRFTMPGKTMLHRAYVLSFTTEGF